jgi:hypothetical protein
VVDSGSAVPVFVEDGRAAEPPAERVPDVMHFLCPCGAALVAIPSMYDTAISCPECGELLFLEVRWCGESRTYGLWPSRA